MMNMQATTDKGSFSINGNFHKATNILYGDKIIWSNDGDCDNIQKFYLTYIKMMEAIKFAG